MKIVIATAVYYPMINGVAVFSHNLAVGLVKRGNDVMVICPSQNGKNYTKTVDGIKMVYLKSINAKVYPDQIHAVPPRKRFLGVEWPHLLYKNGFRVSVFPWPEVKKALSDFKPDVVHVQISDPVGLSVVSYARKMGIPVVTTEHNQPEVITDPLKMPKVMKKPAVKLLSAYFWNRQSKSDFVTMPTKQAVDDLILSKGKAFPVPVAAVSNGVDLSNFKPEKAKKEIYQKYGIMEDVPTVLYIGRVDPEKQVGTLIEAYLLAKEKISSAQLVIVGDGVDKVRLQKKYGYEKSIKFLGRVVGDDLYQLYRVGQVFATASEIETQGVVLIEAAASGLPLIAVNKGAVSEICRNEENGFLCKPGDINEISGAIVKVLTNPKMQAEMSKKSVGLAKEHDFERTLDKFINIYQKLISGKDKL